VLPGHFGRTFSTLLDQQLGHEALVIICQKHVMSTRSGRMIGTAAARSFDERKRAALHADLTYHQARWDAEAERLGFEEIKRQEDEAWSQEAQASDAIFRARATSLAGIEIKITLIVELCSTGPDDPESPWPQLRSTLADVKCLRRKCGAVQC
jgi:hypothetical protein